MILTRTYENDKYVKFLKQKQIPFVAVGKSLTMMWYRWTTTMWEPAENW